MGLSVEIIGATYKSHIRNFDSYRGFARILPCIVLRNNAGDVLSRDSFLNVLEAPKVTQNPQDVNE
jgi:hypothetical protein